MSRSWRICGRERGTCSSVREIANFRQIVSFGFSSLAQISDFSAFPPLPKISLDSPAGAHTDRFGVAKGFYPQKQQRSDIRLRQSCSGCSENENKCSEVMHCKQICRLKQSLCVWAEAGMKSATHYLLLKLCKPCI